MARRNFLVGDLLFGLLGGMMMEAGIREAVVRPAARSSRRARVRAATCWDEILVSPIEIMAPDRVSANALLGTAGTRFRAKLAETAGSAVVVRLEPASVSAGWVFELLAVVERWLDASRFPVALARYGGRSYVIRASASDQRSLGEVDLVPAA